MLPDPLHPAVVHFPIVLAFLLPIFAAGALWAIRSGAEMRRAWAMPAVLAVALTASGWLALQTGEAQEERVEPVVGEAVLHEHEEAAERFLVLSGLVLVVAGVGFAGGTVGSAGRLLATVGSLAVVVAAFAVGDAGGELVYRHGAAQPYVTSAAAGTTRTAVPERDHSEEEEDR